MAQHHIRLVFALAWLGLFACKAVAQCDRVTPMLPRAPASYISTLATFDPDGDGPLPELLIAGGYFKLSTFSDNAHVAAFDGQTWREIGGAFDNYVGTILPWQDRLVVLGRFSTVDHRACAGLATWDGTDWTPLGAALSSAGGNPFVSSVALLFGDLYVAGRFDRAGGVAVSNIARFDGAQWHDVAGGIDSVNASLLTVGGTLIVTDSSGLTRAGQEAVSGGAWWNGDGWQAIAPPASGEPSSSGPFFECNGVMYGTSSYYQVGTRYYQLFSRTSPGEPWQFVDQTSGPNSGGAGRAWTSIDNELWQQRWWYTIGQSGNNTSASGLSVNTRGGMVRAAKQFQGDRYIAGSFEYVTSTDCYGPIFKFSGGTLVPVWPMMQDAQVLVGANQNEVIIGVQESQGWSNEPPGVARHSSTLKLSGASTMPLLQGESTCSVPVPMVSQSLSLVTISDQCGYRTFKVHADASTEPLAPLDGFAPNGWTEYQGEIIAWGSRGTTAIGPSRVRETGLVPLPAGVPLIISWAGQMGTQLIAIGQLDAAPYPPRIVSFDGTSWRTLTSSFTVAASCIHQGRLHILIDKGYNGTSARQYDLRTWNGTSWTLQPSFLNVSGSFSTVSVLTSFNGMLYACGAFSGVNGAWARNVARFDGIRWSGAGNGTPVAISRATSGPETLYLVPSQYTGASTPLTEPTGLIYALQKDLWCIADFNCDGGVDGMDVEHFFGLWQSGLPNADIDSSGATDGGDIGAFFDTWANGC